MFSPKSMSNLGRLTVQCITDSAEQLVQTVIDEQRTGRRGLGKCILKNLLQLTRAALCNFFRGGFFCCSV